MPTLFDPINLAGLRLPNRIVMAPMTRARARSGVPDAETALYYHQRASAGLIISEGIPVSQEGTGFLFVPGLYTDEQQAGWGGVTRAVHEAGGRIFAQLWHVGRMSHQSLQPHGGKPVSSVARAAAGASAYGWLEAGVAGMVPADTPRALEATEIPRLVADFRRAARRAMDAGFDGVELHAANAYLFEQFINGELNTRTDAYGGSIENRIRLLLETIDAMSEEIGSKSIGVRITPFGRMSDMKGFADEADTWLAVAHALNRRGLAYLHCSDKDGMADTAVPREFASAFRSAYQGTLVSAGGFTLEGAQAAVQSTSLDMVAFGRPFISNPDFVERMRNGWPLEEADRATFYGPHGAKGYTDYTRYMDPALCDEG
jgi:2,4-dienoyl-CoA reductase-like NADH-dependent reductase (Old Yellow Enzyme family)